jgi:hypothetical protein
MKQLQCKFCNTIICEDIERIKDVKWITCPNCDREPFLNPYYDEK